MLNLYSNISGTWMRPGGRAKEWTNDQIKCNKVAIWPFLSFRLNLEGFRGPREYNTQHIAHVELFEARARKTPFYSSYTLSFSFSLFSISEKLTLSTCVQILNSLHYFIFLFIFSHLDSKSHKSLKNIKTRRKI